MTKSDISKKVNELRKVGYFVSNRNSKNPLPASMKGDTDFFIAGKGRLIFIEVKLAKDTLKPEQIELAEILIAMSNSISTIFYILETGETINNVIDCIMFQRWNDLNTISKQTHKIK